MRKFEENIITINYKKIDGNKIYLYDYNTCYHKSNWIVYEVRNFIIQKDIKRYYDVQKLCIENLLNIRIKFLETSWGHSDRFDTYEIL